MNNKIAIAIVVIIIIAAGAFFMTRKDNSDSTKVDSNTEATSETAAETSVATGSIKSLIEGGRNQMCTFESKEQNANTAGTMYISGGKMRGDFSTEASGVKTISHMMYDGTMSYVWMDGQKTGFKMALDANAQSSTQTQGIDPNKNYEYSCERWSVDNSKFELPSGVTFSEMPSLPSAAAGASGGADSKDIQRAVCNNLPEPGKTQCLSTTK